MHPDLEKLLQLDETDRAIARLRAEVAALPRRVGEIEAKLAGVRTEVDKNRKALKDIETSRRKHEGDIQALQQKISKYRDQMLAVKTNQEYRALGNEIQFAEQEIRVIEDRILEGMLEVENREKQLKSAEVEQKKQQAEVDSQKAEAQARTEEDQKQLSELMTRREALRKTISSDPLRHYDRVLKLRGTAIAEVREQYCQACHVMIRPQVYNDVMAGQQVLTCDSCYRILYFNSADTAPAVGSTEAKAEAKSTVAEASDPS